MPNLNNVDISGIALVSSCFIPKNGELSSAQRMINVAPCEGPITCGTIQVGHDLQIGYDMPGEPVVFNGMVSLPWGGLVECSDDVPKDVKKYADIAGGSEDNFKKAIKVLLDDIGWNYCNFCGDDKYDRAVTGEGDPQRNLPWMHEKRNNSGSGFEECRISELRNIIFHYLGDVNV